MTKYTRKPKRKPTTQAERYQKLAAGTIKLLERGVAPWRKGWVPPRGPNKRHHNGSSGHQYRGFNPLALDVSTLLNGYTSRTWLTYKQALDLGGYVKAGETGTSIAWWSRVEITDKDSDTQEEKRRSFLTVVPYTLFNLEQTEGVKLPKRETQEPEDKSFDPIAEAQSILDKYLTKGPKLHHNGGDEAFYSHASDSIHLPEPYQFKTREEYHSTAFHEAGHSTGYKTRLNRRSLQEEAGSVRFGSPVYSKEELVAELTASFLCDEAGITTTQETSAAYLASWLRVIRKDPQFLIGAATKAGEAADYILSAGQQKPAYTQDDKYFQHDRRTPKEVKA